MRNDGFNKELHMYYQFRRRVDEYQLERQSVILEDIPDSELIIGILNRLDPARYSSLVTIYLSNARQDATSRSPQMGVSS